MFRCPRVLARVISRQQVPSAALISCNQDAHVTARDQRRRSNRCGSPLVAGSDRALGLRALASSGSPLHVMGAVNHSSMWIAAMPSSTLMLSPSRPYSAYPDSDSDENECCQRGGVRARYVRHCAPPAGAGDGGTETLEELRKDPVIKELHSEIKMLARILADTIEKAEGVRARNLVLDVWQLARSWRDAKDRVIALEEQLARTALEGVHNKQAIVAQDLNHAINAARSSFEDFSGFLEGTSAEDLELLTRAFSHMVQLANAAEQNLRARVVRRERVAGTRRVEDIHHNVHEVLRHGTAGDLDEVLAVLRSCHIEMVLTAHPTEVRRPELVQKHLAVQELLHKLSPPDTPDLGSYKVHEEPRRPHLTQVEHDELMESLKRVVAEAWSTDQVLRQRPTPVEEAQAGLFVIDESLWEAVPALMRRVDHAARHELSRRSNGDSKLQEAAAEWIYEGELPGTTTLIRFSSWIGGDRDGNASVTPAVTREVTLRSRAMALRRVRHDLRRLYNELSMHRADAQLDAAARVIQAYREGVPESEAPVVVDFPYRVVVQRLIDRAETTLALIAGMITSEQPGDFGAEKAPAPGAGAISLPRHDGRSGRVTLSVDAVAATSSSALWHRDDILVPLKLVFASLVNTGYRVIANGPLLDIIRSIASFGVTGTRLDLKQDSKRHADAMDAIMHTFDYADVRYSDLSEAQRCEFLERELSSPAGARPPLPADFQCSPEVQDTLDTFRVAAEVGSEPLGVYVTSMAKSASDVMVVYLLQRVCGIARDDFVPVVPLFELEADVATAAHTVNTLLRMPVYRAIIQGNQQVMIGYSESGKDAGRLAAAWTIFKAQEDLVAVCDAATVHLTLFHGKGGTVSRGGGTAGRGAYRAVLAQPPGTVRGKFRATEQGEMIQLHWGVKNLAIKTAETYASAVFRHNCKEPEPVEPQWRAIMDKLAAASATHYRETVRTDDADESNLFAQYFDAVTPCKELPRLNIGSRPDRRLHKGGSIDTLHAIPWVFSWKQLRANLPAWLGLGKALSNALDSEDDARCLRCMYQHWPFFHELVSLVEMVLAKSDEDIWREYDRQLIPTNQARTIELSNLGERLRAEMREASAAILAITGHKYLGQGNRVLQASLSSRNEFVDPLSVILPLVLRKLRFKEYMNSNSTVPHRTDDDEKRELEDAARIAIAGIANGIKNAG